MKVMKAVFFVPFFLFFLGPLTLSASTSTPFSTLEKISSPIVSWVQVAPLHQEVAVEFENELEENTSNIACATNLVSTFEPTTHTYINVFYIPSTSLWNHLLQFRSLFTTSPPLS